MNVEVSGAVRVVGECGVGVGGWWSGVLGERERPGVGIPVLGGPGIHVGWVRAPTPTIVWSNPIHRISPP